MQENIDRKNLIVMKLLHYFITEQNYNPIILQGVDNEIWLENLSNDYKIIRIVSNHIHNEEQFNFDMFKTKRVVKKIKKKTFSFKMNVLSIFTDIEDNVDLESGDNIDCVYLYDEKDINKYKILENFFPDMDKKLDFNEEGLQLFMKITDDINKKNKNDALEVEDIFTPKKPIVTKMLVITNIVIHLLSVLFDCHNELIIFFSNWPLGIRNGEFYRLITSAFLHADIFHLLFNCYALYVIGNQIESFMGRTKFLIIYLFSALTGSLLSMVFLGNGISIGASGAIFGLMGSLLYFGYYYRVYLGNVVKSQILPLIIVNLVLGFVNKGIDNAAHIGGLIGGIVITMALGLKYKSSTFEKVNGFIITLLLVLFLGYMAFVYAA